MPKVHTSDSPSLSQKFTRSQQSHQNKAYSITPKSIKYAFRRSFRLLLSLSDIKAPLMSKLHTPDSRSLFQKLPRKSSPSQNYGGSVRFSLRLPLILSDKKTSSISKLHTSDFSSSTQKFPKSNSRYSSVGQLLSLILLLSDMKASLAMFSGPPDPSSRMMDYPFQGGKIWSRIISALLARIIPDIIEMIPKCE